MTDYVLVWDLETVRDLAAGARVFDLVGQSDDAVQLAFGTEFPKLPLHRIACIGALLGSQSFSGWQIEALGAPYIGERTERADRRLRRQDCRSETSDGDVQCGPLICPCFRYRAMVHRVRRRGLYAHPISTVTPKMRWICDVLAAFDPRAKVKLISCARRLALRGSRVASMGRRSRPMLRKEKLPRLLHIARRMSSTPIAFCLSMNCFRGGCRRRPGRQRTQFCKNFIRQLVTKPHLRI